VARRGYIFAAPVGTPVLEYPREAASSPSARLLERLTEVGDEVSIS